MVQIQHSSAGESTLVAWLAGSRRVGGVVVVLVGGGSWSQVTGDHFGELKIAGERD
jgi:hypothetical protein